ncbi:hypothetical protein AXG93_3873s1220 [Marchantia polymorpha subsp. ruderalis]|uniref:ODAD1 central coiled coil region domain-containing protein n=1 Tax=Marchantia polymorpha subsp. ruderalis TaxID=1480154 RepID=A0A176VI21_MARPO|nr:hypothetical protein AXG93_3873s1220 [Marchantia polymorpha subsp. ruderalis]
MASGSYEDKPHVRFGDDNGDDEEEIDYTQPKSPKSPKSRLDARRATPGVLQHFKPTVHPKNIPTSFGIAAAFAVQKAPKPPPPAVPPEDEMKELHKKFRMMTASQRHFHAESETVLRRQRALLDTLLSDNRSVQQQIDLYYNEDVLAEIARLRENVTYMTAKIEVEAKRLSELDHVTQEMNTREWDSRKLMGGVFAPRDKEHHNQIYICILENRLEKAMGDMDACCYYNKCLLAEMQGLKTEHDMFDILSAKLDIELHQKIAQMAELVEDCYALYEQRDDFQRLISEILEMEAEGEAYKRWQLYGSWIGLDGRPLAETAFKLDERQQKRLKMKRPTLPLTNEASLREIFSIQDDDNMTRFVSKPYTKKYEKVIEIKAFMKTQEVLGFETKDVDPVLPALLAARERHAELLRKVQALNAEIESAAAARLGSFMDSDDEEEDNQYDDMFAQFSENDFLRLIRELKRQIYTVFKDAGLSTFDEGLETAIMDGTVHDDSLEFAITKLFSKTENFIEEISEPAGLNETRKVLVSRDGLQFSAPEPFAKTAASTNAQNKTILNP